MKWFMIILILVTGACKKRERDESAPMPTINDGGVLTCPICPVCRIKTKGQRDLVDAKIEAARLIGRPVICDTSPKAGTTCWDTLGAVVWCPYDLADACVASTKVPEAQTMPLVTVPAEAPQDGGP